MWYSMYINTDMNMKFYKEIKTETYTFIKCSEAERINYKTAIKIKNNLSRKKIKTVWYVLVTISAIITFNHNQCNLSRVLT